jgi:hypothetical protein
LADWFTSSLSVPKLITYFQTHQKLYDKIKTTLGFVPSVNAEPVEDTDNNADHMDISMQAVVHKALDLDLSLCANLNSTFCVDDNIVQLQEDGSLQAVSILEQAHETGGASDAESDNTDNTENSDE